MPISTIPTRPAAERLLALAASGWCLVALAGQGVFALYVALFYGRSAWAGDFEAWNRVLYRGWIAGDQAGNLAVALHLALAVAVITSGALQLWPALRAHAPAVHRWNGRFYATAALMLALGGLVMVWTRGTVGGLVMHLSISANALVIVGCAAMAWRHALQRRFDSHRRWALRLFIAVSGVWFFRVGLMLWLLVHRAPVGFDPKSFQGPFLSFLGFAQFVLPLAVLELCLRARRDGSRQQQLAMAGALIVLTITMAAGIVSASAGMWLSRLV